MGSPGSGKTTVGRILGKSLGMPVIDVDDHHLEPYWGMSVAKKVKTRSYKTYSVPTKLKDICNQANLFLL